MKKYFSFLGLLLLAQLSFAQTTVTKDANGNKVIRGFISRKELASDSAFTWFAQNTKGYTPNAAAVQALKSAKDSIRILAFGGTWCGDTKHILPKFYALTDAAGLAEDKVVLLGVDNSKKTIQNLSETFAITNVPTFIVLKNGKEIGRVVEYGTSGQFDKDLGEIIAGTKK